VRRAPLLVALILAGFAAPAASAGPLRTALFDPTAYASSERQAISFARSRAAGASLVRLTLQWRFVAPASPPPGFNAVDPGSPGYNWGWFDHQVRLARAHGLEPFVEIIQGPPWAAGGELGIVRPNAVEFGKFARAAATRYSGGYGGLPRIRYWQAWAEPNRDYFLFPQYEGGRIWAAHHYRAMLTQFAWNVWAVNPSNRVIAGALSPLARQGKPAPLAFMREMFCLSRRLRRTCDLRGSRVPFDIWSHHAYTNGGPTHRGSGDNVVMGDLGKMKRVLRAARRVGHVHSHGRVPFWVTEFSWDSNPPDPRAISASLQSRWISEALFRMWQQGVTVATWWKIQDESTAVSRYQSGLFNLAGRPKRSLAAFRFPVVGFRRSGGVYVWGMTPSARRGRVVVQIKSGGGWRRLGVVRTNSHGIFARTFRAYPRGYVRARFGRARSLPFSLARVPDRQVDPFGCGGPLAPC
jgi:hypothetical protein